MRLNDDVSVLELQVVFGRQSLPVSLSLVVDRAMGATLVDTGGPGSEVAIVGALAEAGVGMGDLRRIVLTHQDLDVRAIVCYHGGVVDDDANGQLRRLAAAVGTTPAR